MKKPLTFVFLISSLYLVQVGFAAPTAQVVGSDPMPGMVMPAPVPKDKSAPTVTVSGSDSLVILEKDHAAYAAKFEAAAKDNEVLRTAIQANGADVAFTDWMQQNHPYVYAAAYVNLAKSIVSHAKRMGSMREFDSLAKDKDDIKNSVASEGHDVAFVDWLRANHPGEYREQVRAVSSSKPSVESSHDHSDSKGCSMSGMNM